MNYQKTWKSYQVKANTYTIIHLYVLSSILAFILLAVIWEPISP